MYYSHLEPSIVSIVTIVWQHMTIIAHGLVIVLGRETAMTSTGFLSFN